MGDARNVHVYCQDDQGVYLYTHWGGSELPETVATALERGKERWDDPPYLARIIFCEMVRGSNEGLTGFGISGPADRTHGYADIEVDVKHKQVWIGGHCWTFDGFIEAQCTPK